MTTLQVSGHEYELLEKGLPCFLGRWFQKELDGVPHTVTVTAGAQVWLTTEGAKTVTAIFTSGETPGMTYVACSVDGGEPQRHPVGTLEISLPDRGRHVVCLTADGFPDGAAYGGGRWEEEMLIALREVHTDSEGCLWGVRPVAPLIFFFGDSITEGVHVISDGDGALLNSAMYAYPRYCAEALGANPYYIGYGGSGLLREGWFSTMERAIDSLSGGHGVADSPAACHTPDLIVVNHGTNDMDYPMMDFMYALRSALSLLYRRYPDVPLVYVIPLRQTHAFIIRRLVAEYPSGWVVETEGWPMSYTDGLHPNAASARLMGRRVAEAIRELGLL